MQTRMKIGAAVAAIALGLFSQSAKAVITNGDFSGSPDLTGWSPIGDNSVQGGDFNPPSPATTIAFLTNRTTNNVSATPATTNIASLDAASNLPANTLETLGAHSGSTLSQTFFATIGDTVSFNYNFLTNEPVAGFKVDQGFYTLKTPSSAATFVSLGTPATAGTNPPLVAAQQGIYDFLGSGTGRETNNQLTSIPITATGLYTITFGVFNQTDDTDSSGLLVTNVTGATGTGAPLPAAIFLAPIGMAVASRYSKKFRRKTA